MTTIKTQDLTGAALDWAVAKAIGRKVELTQFFASMSDGSQECGLHPWCQETNRLWHPRLNWMQCGPLIEDNGIEIESGPWSAYVNGCTMHGDTALEAVCRVIVAANMGYEINVPEVLV